MPLSDGDPADSGDTWLRILIEKRWIRDDGKVSHNAFAKRILPPPPEQKRAWSQELSGGLHSLIDDVIKYGEAYCATVSRNIGKQKEFSGIMYAEVGALRAQLNQVRTDVYKTDSPTDAAHADFVLFNYTDQDFDKVRDWLQETFRGLRPNQIEQPFPPKSTTLPAV